MSITDEPRTASQDALEPPPQPIADDDKLGRKTWVALAAVVLLILFAYFMLTRGDANVSTAEDIGSVYSSSVIVTVHEGDTLQSVVDTTFPNFLVEGVSDQNVARFKMEWARQIALRSAIAGGNLAAGQRLAIPALPDDPGAVEKDQLERALQPDEQSTTTTSGG